MIKSEVHLGCLSRKHGLVCNNTCELAHQLHGVLHDTFTALLTYYSGVHVNGENEHMQLSFLTFTSTKVYEIYPITK